MMNRVTVRVPASVSNLGPGFDCLGVALRLYNFITATRTAKNDALPAILDETAKVFFRESRARQFGFSLSVKENLPRARGLGSSATVRLGLLHALNRLSGDPLDRNALFRVCAQLEGHPDNAAPASFGGFTVARPDVVQRFDVSSRLKFVVVIPDHEVETRAARKILPNRIVRVKAVRSCGDACAITAAFVSKNYQMLEGMFRDELHQPFRAKLIPYLPRVINAAERGGALGAFLSGSGSSIAALTLKSPQAIARSMRNAVGKIASRTVILSADNHGVEITQHKL
jgi:homoserine kinase